MPTPSATGKDVTLNLTIAGVRVDECAATDFTETSKYDTIEVKPLGKDITEEDNSFAGWSGTITFVERDGRLQAFIDAYHLALRNRLDPQLSITRTTNYRDGSSNTRTYRSVHTDFSAQYTRGQANTVTLNWRTGYDRI